MNPRRTFACAALAMSIGVVGCATGSDVTGESDGGGVDVTTGTPDAKTTADGMRRADTSILPGHDGASGHDARSSVDSSGGDAAKSDARGGEGDAASGDARSGGDGASAGDAKAAGDAKTGGDAKVGGDAKTGSDAKSGGDAKGGGCSVSSECVNQACVSGVCTGVCTPGATECAGATPQTCSATGAWVSQTACAQPTPDCASGSCTCTGVVCNGSCTTLDTTASCGACGVTCTPTNATSPTCNGSTCFYKCNAGALDCNANVAPDSDGCECTTPSCCGTSCQTTHADGWGQSFYDCNALGTFTSASAVAACAAYALTMGGSSANCLDIWQCSFSGPTYVCYGDPSGASCDGPCWDYTGGQAGGTEGACSCPFSSTAMWN